MNPNNVQSPVMASPKKRSIKKIVLITISLILVAIGAIIFTVFSATNEQANVSEQFVSALQTNNVDVAYNLTSPEFQTSTSKASFATFVAQENSFLPKTKANVTSRTLNTSSSTPMSVVVATVKSDVTISDNYTVTVNLVKLDGKWLVQNIDIKKA